MATKVAGSMASAHDAWIELLHVITADDSDRREQADEHLSAARNRLTDVDNVDTWVLEAENVAEPIIEQSRYYDARLIAFMEPIEIGLSMVFVTGGLVGYLAYARNRADKMGILSQYILSRSDAMPSAAVSVADSVQPDGGNYRVDGAVG